MGRWPPWLLVVTALACGDSVTPPVDTGVDLQAPSITDASIRTGTSDSTEVDADGTISWTFHASDDVAVARTIVAWDGAFAGEDAMDHPSPSAITRQGTIHVPAGVTLGDSVEITFRAIDGAGHMTAYRMPFIRIVDTRPPAVVMTLEMPSPAVPGDTARIDVTADDSVGVRWLGYRLGAPSNLADSISVTDKVATHTFTPVVSKAWVGASQIEGFARDGAANLGVSGSTPLWVIDAVRRPVDTLHLGGGAADLAVAPDGSRAYLSQFYLERVAVVRLDTLVFASPIPAPAQDPWGLDVSPDGTMLVMAMNSTPARLGLADLTQIAPVTNVVQVSDNGEWFNVLRVASNGKATIGALVATWGMIWDYDLATATPSERTELGAVAPPVAVARSADRKRILFTFLSESEAALEVTARLYDAVTDSFSTAVSVESDALLSADSTGMRFLMGNDLYDGSLKKQKSFTPPDLTYYFARPPTALSVSGEHVYMASSFGYAKVRVSDDALVEQVVLPFAPTRLWVLPGEHRLIALRDQTIALVKLN